MIDFREIPQANTGSGDQDLFELFARDFFKSLGYEIVENPARGADNGRDLIISEKFTSQLNSKVNERRWLVSCKHYVFSGKSVTASDEQDINDRIKSHNCYGFIGFYSTIPNESLKTKLKNVENTIFDRKRIEEQLLTNEKLQHIFKSYYPLSFEKYLNTEVAHQPLNLFDEFFSNNEKFKNSIFFHKLFPTKNLYNGFLICNTFEELLRHLGFEARLVKFIDDYDKVARNIMIAGYNENIDENKKTDRDYNSIKDENLRKMIYEMENPKRLTDEEVREIVQEIILDYEIPKNIKIYGSGFSAQRLKGFGVYFYTENEIYMNIFEYRHLRNLFVEIKNKYFN